MFTINDLSVGYGPKVVLHNLSLEVPSGSVTGIVGYNGVGKTTLLDAVYGMIEAPHEAFTLDGRVLTRRHVAYLPSENFFYSGITGRDYLELFSGGNPRFDVTLWQRLLPLPLDEPIEGYSTGMRKKLALVGVLAQDKPLVMLDEPFNGLDVEGVSVLGLVVRRLAAVGKCLIITSHIIESLTVVCDRIAVLRDGTVQKVYSRDQFSALRTSIDDEMELRYKELVDKAVEGS